MFFCIFGRFIPNFILAFEAIVNSILFPSEFRFLLLVFKKVTDFPILVLHPVTLLHSLIGSRRFLFFSCWFLEFSTYTVLSSVNKISFISYVPMWMHFLSFSCMFSSNSSIIELHLHIYIYFLYIFMCKYIYNIYNI